MVQLSFQASLPKAPISSLSREGAGMHPALSYTKHPCQFCLSQRDLSSSPKYPGRTKFQAQCQDGWGYGQWKMSLPKAGGLELGGLQGPFQPKPLCDWKVSWRREAVLGEETLKLPHAFELGAEWKSRRDVTAKSQFLTLYTSLHTRLPTNKAHSAFLFTSYFTLTYE